MKRQLASFAIAFFTLAALAAERPYWWDNPHRDDSFFMYERGTVSSSKSEQDAIRGAVLAAKGMIVDRIGISSALAEAGLSAAPEYALVNVEVSDSGTEQDAKSKTWSAWVLVKYPQEEKKKILDRWNASISSIGDLRTLEGKIPSQFVLSLATADGRLQFRDGEHISFIVEADKDCWLLLVDHQSDGSSVVLFPNRFQPSGFVKRGQRIVIPPADAGSFKLLVGAPYGDDRIEAIGVTKKSVVYTDIESSVKDLSAGQNMVVLGRSDFVEKLTASLEGTAASSPGWGRAVLSLSTFAKQ
jgi:hypothetical protein